MIETLLSAISDCAWAYNLHKKEYAFISPEIQHVLSVSADELNNDHDLWCKIIVAEDRQNVLGLTQNLNKNTWTELNYRIKTSDGVKHIAEKKTIITAQETGHDVIMGIVKDMTCKKNSNYSLQGNGQENFFNVISGSQANFLIRVSEKGLFTFANTRFLETFKYTAEELNGKHFSITVLPEDEHECQETLRLCLNNPGKIYNLVHPKLDSTGKAYFTEWEFTGLVNPDGMVDVQGIGQDITAQIATQEEIQQTAKKLDRIIESITDNFCVINYHGEFTRVNMAFKKTFSQQSDCIGRPFDEVFLGIVDTDFDRLFTRAVQQQETTKVTQYFAQAGLWMDISMYPSDEGIIVFLKDITLAKQAREEILMGKNNLESLINTTDDLVWSVNTDFEIISMNTSFKNSLEKKYGFKLIDGFNLKNAGFDDLTKIKWVRIYDRALKGERFTIHHEAKDMVNKKTYYFEIKFNPILDKNGDVYGVGCFAHDITDRLSIERDIIEQNQRLRNIASLSSHELRRPVATVMGLTSIFDHERYDNPSNAEIIDHLKSVSEELDQVIRQIVNNTFMHTTTEETWD